MDIEQMKGLSYKRVYRELKDFTDEALQHTKSDIIARCFEINLYIVLYEILLEEIEKMDKQGLKTLLSKESILKCLYEAYTDLYGDDYERIKQFVKEVVEE